MGETGDEIQTLRNRLRMSLVQQRKSLREIQVLRQRVEFDDTEDGDFTESQIVTIIHKVRKRGRVTVSELSALRIYFSDKENVPLFFKYVGALHGLVGEMTGSDTRKQLLAAECICYLTLGTTANCLSIAKSAGVYLMTFLAGSNILLAEVCAWTLGNLACSSPKASDVLREQGLLKTLIPLLTSEYEEIKSSVMNALAHVLHMNPSIILEDELKQIVDILSDFSNYSRYQARLLFATSSNGFAVCPAFAEHKIFTKVVNEIVKLVSEKEWENNLAVVVYSLRTAANIVSDEEIMYIERDVLLQDEFIKVLRKLLACQRKNVVKLLLWFFGNIESHTVLTVDFKIDYISKFSDLIALCI